MNKLLIIIGIVALLLGSSTLSAQFEKLEITAPENATVGEEVTITVTYDGDPIEDATVLIDVIPIGETDANGQIKHTFSIIGIYLIAATKWGYIPSNPFTITIEKPLLTISVDPLVPNVGDEVTITVKANYLDPVEGATVFVKEDIVGGTYSSIGTTDSNGEVTYTFGEGGAYLLKAEKVGYISSFPYPLTVIDVEPLLTISVNPLVPNAGDEVTITVKVNYLDPVEGATVFVKVVGGTYSNIGTTDSNGQVMYIFNEGGAYLIRGEKYGYTNSVPYPLTVTDIEPLLTISVSPIVPYVEEEITITVKANYIDLVGGATVSVKEDIIGGTYTAIGTTDGYGQLKYTFSEGGVYLIKAEKYGYTDSGPCTVVVNDVIEPLLIVTVNPLAPDAGEEVTITVKANLLPVAGATVSVKEDIIGETYNNIGVTDNNGQVKYMFDDGGAYLIGAEKSGYTDAAPYPLVVLDIDILENITIQGAVFPIPDLLGEELLKYEGLPFQLPYVSLVATEDKLFIIFSDGKIEKGLASVDGWKLLSITWEGLKIGIVQAEDTSVDKEGIQVTIDEIKSNPEDYALKLVQIDATIRQCPFLLDIASLNMPITVGRVVKDPITAMDLSNLIEKTYDFDENLGRERLEQIINLAGDGLSIFDFGTAEYWIDSEAVVNAVVLYPGIVEEFVSVMGGNEIKDLVIPSGETVLLYNVNTELKSVEISIEEITSDTEKYTDKVVSFEGSDLGVSVSIKNTLSALSGIGELLPVDLLLHGTIAWGWPPPVFEEIQDSILITVGVSSHCQDKPLEVVNGAREILRYTGKVVSAKQVNENLDGILLIVYEREKTGEIPLEEILSEVKERIQEKVVSIKYILQRMTPELVDIPTILAGELEIIEVERGDIKNITICLRDKAEDVSISILKFKVRPFEVTVNASGEVYAYLEISAENIPDESVENVSIEFKVNKSWIIEADIDEESVRLCRYSDGIWDVLSTRIVRETSTEVYYSAESLGLSFFAITGEQVPEETPGFEFIIIICAITILLFWRRHRRKK